jgi:hypothetical protein
MNQPNSVMNQQYQTRLNQTKHFEEFWSKQDGELPRQVTAVVVGAGLRGQNYANFALDFPSRLKIVGVAEPQKHRREKLQKLHDIPDEYALDDWSKLAILDKIADLAIISTQDHMHKDPAIAFANLGYHLLLEKPMAVKEIDCEQIAESCERNKVMAAVGHVMRYVYMHIRDYLLPRVDSTYNFLEISGVGLCHCWRIGVTSTKFGNLPAKKKFPPVFCEVFPCFFNARIKSKP